MRIELFFMCVIFLILIPNVHAISTDLKPVYQPGETIIGKISGNILESLNKNQIRFLRGHVDVPFEYDLQKIKEEYYMWATAPLNVSQNYTLLIENVFTTLNGQQTEIDYRQNFSVFGNLTEYSVKPGAVITDKDFELKVQSYLDENQNIQLDFPVSGESVLKPGMNTLIFSIEQVVGEQFKLIRVGKYQVPVYIIGSASANSNIVSWLKIEPERIYLEKKDKNEIVRHKIIVEYRGAQEVNDLNIIFNKEVLSIEPEEIANLEINKSIELNISIRNNLSDINEFIRFESKKGNFSRSVPVFVSLRYDKNGSGPNGNNESKYYCSELAGKICTGGEICQGTAEESLDGNCCIGSCAKQETESIAWIGYLIGAILAGFLIFIYFRYKKTKKDKNIVERKFSEAENKIAKP